MSHAGWKPTNEAELERTGVLIGSGIGGVSLIAENAIKLEKEGPRRIAPYFIPASLINEASGVVSIRHGFRGPNHSVVTACATGAHALGDAARLIALGDADVMGRRRHGGRHLSPHARWVLAHARDIDIIERATLGSLPTLGPRS